MGLRKEKCWEEVNLFKFSVKHIRVLISPSIYSRPVDYLRENVTFLEKGCSCLKKKKHWFLIEGINIEFGLKWLLIPWPEEIFPFFRENKMSTSNT